MGLGRATGRNTPHPMTRARSSSPDVQSRGREWAARLALSASVFAGCLVLILLAEIGARRHDPAYLVRVRGLHVFSDVFGWTLRPGASTWVSGARVSVNAEGYRGPLLPAPDRSQTRVVVLGDSVAFGHDVADGVPFPWQLDTRGTGLRVANLAVPGYGPTQEWLVLRGAGLALRPDIVVLCFCRANDFVDTVAQVFLYDGVTPKPHCALTGDQLVLYPPQTSAWRRLLLRFADESHLLNRALTLSRPAAEPGLARGAAQGESWEDRYRRLYGDGDNATRTTLAVIRRMAEATVQRDSAFVLAVFPDRRAFRRSPARRMAEFQGFGAQDGVALIDMADRFQRRGLAFDDVASDTIGHLSPRGHAFAADILEEELLALARRDKVG